ncbi:MAG: biotin/lipoyl-binding protein [Planctomycetes bacterium]|nr:biotin/lipoyl-binding protein [Planctomycetota bacterium]
MRLFVHINGHRHEFEVSERHVGPHQVALDDQDSSIRTAFLDNRRIEFGWARRDGTYTIQIDGIEYQVDVRDALAERAAESIRATARTDGEMPVYAPIPGLVRRVLVSEGQTVAKDQPVLTLDAMKLENELPAPRDGVVRSVKVQPGTPVEKGQVLVVIG